MALFPVKTLDGKLTLDTTARTVYMGSQGGSIDGGSAMVDTAGAIDKRITATRLVLTGVFALAWRKKKDARELYLLVEGATFSLVARVDPKESANTRKFAAAINTTARGGQPTAMSLGGAARNAAVSAERKEKNTARRALLTPEQRRAEDKRHAIIGVIVVAAIVLFIVITSINGKSGTSTTSAPVSVEHEITPTLLEAVDAGAWPLKVQSVIAICGRNNALGVQSGETKYALNGPGKTFEGWSDLDPIWLPDPSTGAKVNITGLMGLVRADCK